LSLTYVFIQDNSIWFFAKGLMFLFCLFLLLGMFDLYRQTGQVGYALGVLVTYGLFVALLRFRFINSGYADVPVATLAYAGVYALLLARGAAGAAAQWKYIFLGGVICAGAALTKQAGLFIAAVYPLLAWLLVERTRRLAPLLLLAGLLVAMIAPWYAYKQIAIANGQEHTLTAYLLNDIHAGRNLWQRLIHAGGLLREALSLPAMLLILAALAFAMRDGVQRRLVLLVAAPFSLLWALGFSYDLRNIALAVPLIGAAAGIGAAGLGQMFLRNRKPTAAPAPIGAPARKAFGTARVLSLRIGYVVLLLAVPVLLLGMRFGRDELIARHRKLQETIGVRDVSWQLCQYQRSQGIEGLIATDYFAMPWLPGVGQYGVYCSADTLEGFRLAYDRPDVKYALIYKDHTCPQVRQYLQAAGGPGRSRLLLDLKAYCFYRKQEDR
jgi:4-amino-4-deoxy-L-arabinose transferase-like glycosyltransferase